jgi:hypothetical protein
MPHIDYPIVISENERELEKLEKRHRYSHLFHRVKMLRLLKSGVWAAIWERLPRLWATAAASARGASSLTSKKVWRNCW